MTKQEDAKEFVSDGINKIKSKMASARQQTYPPPQIPDTPSRTINQMLESRCGKTFDNPIKYYIATYICFAFSAIVKLYSLLHKDSKPSHTMWMVSCGVFCAVSILKAFLIYYIVLGCSFIMHTILYYGSALLGLAGVGLGVSGILFFDKGGKQSPSFEIPSVPGKSE